MCIVVCPFRAENSECDSVQEALRKQIWCLCTKDLLLFERNERKYCCMFVVLVVFSILLQRVLSDFFTYYKLNLVILIILKLFPVSIFSHC